MRTPFDPFGIYAASWEVFNAWLAHPYRLGEEATKLWTEFWALQTWQRLTGAVDHEDLVPPARYDERFEDPAWIENPFLDTLKETYLLYTHWLEDAIFETPWVDEKTRRRAAFGAREVLNALAPSNFFWSNPVAIKRFVETGGMSALRGTANFLADAGKGTISMVDERQFKLGENLATTPGAVIFRNEVLELIQYSPTTDRVHAVPIVIVAPWINKYYILDLERRKSLVRFLVDQGFTVFITSWKNPGPEARFTTLDDYMLKGALKAVEVALDICRVPRVHLAGYCIGGTIVAALLAWLSRETQPDNRAVVEHATLLTTLVEFSRPGDIDVFLDAESLDAIEALMAPSGYLDGKCMAASFRLLRSNSLIWRYWVHNYLYGETPPPFDVLYWNTDATRLPKAMHTFYLRNLYLENKLIRRDALRLGGRPIDLGRITQPLYVVGTEQDHITPWLSTFRICSSIKGPVRYVLATSGHIMGILSPPVQPPKRHYWAGDATRWEDPQAWQASLDKVAGSWWDDWSSWLKYRCGKQAPPPPMGSETYRPLAEAPGTYVLQR
ncbi:MAG: alpha/beta fold hydrolase [Gammaproteobacteria bacterium]|jgi:polyhydroxyalkanoate synthase